MCFGRFVLADMMGEVFMGETFYDKGMAYGYTFGNEYKYHFTTEIFKSGNSTLPTSRMSKLEERQCIMSTLLPSTQLLIHP